MSLNGKDWKDLRAKLTPMFTLGKIKKMVPYINKCAQDLQDVLLQSARTSEDIDIRQFTSKYFADVLLSIVAGTEINYLKNPESETGKMAENIFKLNKRELLKFFITLFLPDMASKLKVISFGIYQ